MVAPQITSAGKQPANTFAAALKNESSLVVILATVGFFFWSGDQIAEELEHPVWITAVFIFLFVIVLWSAISVMRHADVVAQKLGEPYGTLVLTLAAISIEVVTISAAMLHGANNPTLARDMMFAVLMIALNGLVGSCLLIGGLRHREQHYNIRGVNSYLNAIVALSVLGLVLPNYTISVRGPRFSLAQEIFIVISSIALYGIFLLIQTSRHSNFFLEPKRVAIEPEAPHHSPSRSGAFHGMFMVVYLAAVVFLAEKLAIPLDNLIERFSMPQAFGGAIVAALVLAPEGLSALHAASCNHLQRAVNILHGSVLATIGLTIPAVLLIGQITGRSVTLGLEGGNLPLLLLTLAISIVTFANGRTNVLQGCTHLLLFAVFLLLIFCP
ncbi:MAG: calcium:proton antiporter [Verrucomicrobia bacterium]|nr:calcium:proton antiporter [Verrucomicrobiota bacterium]